MLKKSFFVFLVTLLALPVFSTAVFAETEEVVYEDGTHEVPLVVKYGDNAFEQFSEEATVTIENGNQYIQLSHNQLEYILEISLPEGEVDIINEDEEADIREFGFSYQGDLNEPVPFTIHMFYGQNHDMQAFLDMSNVQLVEPEEEPEEPVEEPEQPEEEPIEAEDIELADGFYNLNVSYLRDDNDDASAMARYLNPAAFLAVNDGKTELTITINDDFSVVLLQVEGENAVESVTDGDKRYETFNINNLSSLIDGYVDYQADMGDSIYEGNANFRIHLDEDSITATDESEKPGADIEEDAPEEEPEEPKQPEEPEEPKQPEEPENPKDEDENKDEEDDKEDVVADKLFTIDYRFLHATEDEDSAANGFFTGQAVIVEHDGERFVRITTNAPQFIDSLVAVFGNERVALELVENNGETGVYEFKLPNGFDLSQEIKVEMEITVPGVYEGMVHDTRLVFDVDTLEEIESEEDIPTPAPEDDVPAPEEDEGNDENGTDDEGNDDNNNNGLDPNTPEKPELGDGDNGDNNEGPGAENDRNVLNPQTGENTNILLYVLLLIGSAIPLAIQVKRRFV